MQSQEKKVSLCNENESDIRLSIENSHKYKLFNYNLKINSKGRIYNVSVYLVVFKMLRFVCEKQIVYHLLKWN